MRKTDFDRILELVHGAFKEAGFVADVRRPLKVRVPAPPVIRSSNSHLRNNPFLFTFFLLALFIVALHTSQHVTPSYTVAWSAPRPRRRRAHTFFFRGVPACLR
jgi:hypothetical protein